MTKFLDGPAAGTVLPLRRALMFIRAVCARNGQWDALDQTDDVPKPSETIHVYALKEKASWMHLNCRPRSAGGMFMVGEYLYLTKQPSDAEARTTEAWHAWTLANKSLVAHLLPADNDTPNLKDDHEHEHEE